VPRRWASGAAKGLRGTVWLPRPAYSAHFSRSSRRRSGPRRVDRYGQCYLFGVRLLRDSTATPDSDRDFPRGSGPGTRRVPTLRLVAAAHAAGWFCSSATHRHGAATGRRMAPSPQDPPRKQRPGPDGYRKGGTNGTAKYRRPPREPGPLSTSTRLDGAAFVSGTRMLYVGPLVGTRRHAHHAAQIVIAPQGLYIEDGANGRIRACTAVIPPRLPHGHGACTHAALLVPRRRRRGEPSALS